MRAQPFITPMHRGRLPTCPRRHARVDGPERPSGRNASCGITPSTIMSPTRSHPGPRTEIRLGARAHPPSNSAGTAPVKRSALGPAGRPRGDRAPPPTLTSNHRSLPRPGQQQPGSRACHVVHAQIRGSAPSASAAARTECRVAWIGAVSPSLLPLPRCDSDCARTPDRPPFVGPPRVRFHGVGPGGTVSRSAPGRRARTCALSLSGS
jgi:hypothetical protein